MKNFDVQSIFLQVPQELALTFIADGSLLPMWTQAFAHVNGERALMRTPNGEVEIDLKIRASAEHGTVDWIMTFPDQSIATAYSRLICLSHDSCVFCFILTPPPVPLEQLEGTLQVQSKILAEELLSLKKLIENKPQ